MSKEEIALELTKLAYNNAALQNKIKGHAETPEKVVTDLYNYIFSNMNCKESNE